MEERQQTHSNDQRPVKRQEETDKKYIRGGRGNEKEQENQSKEEYENKTLTEQNDDTDDEEEDHDYHPSDEDDSTNAEEEDYGEYSDTDDEDQENESENEDEECTGNEDRNDTDTQQREGEDNQRRNKPTKQDSTQHLVPEKEGDDIERTTCLNIGCWNVANGYREQPIIDTMLQLEFDFLAITEPIPQANTERMKWTRKGARLLRDLNLEPTIKSQ
jgi:hypothetical protein